MDGGNKGRGEKEEWKQDKWEKESRGGEKELGG